MSMDTATVLREARHRARLSQSALAERAGTSQATISAYETGAKEPSVSTLTRLLAATGHSLELTARQPIRQPSNPELIRRGRILAEVLGLAEALPARRRGGIDHAFGGAIALAFWTREPRGTRDIDLNLFVPAADPQPALAALPEGVRQDAKTVETVKRDGQIRLWWDDTPIDLFFDYTPIHSESARSRQMVPFEGVKVPVLAPLELAVFKAMFDRTRDWGDIEEMIAAGALDADELHDAIRKMVGPDDARHARIDEAERRAGSD
jgi:transcriptional regulator with XRE-family HTH domain